MAAPAGAQIRSITQIENMLDELTQDSEVGPRLYNSIDYIVRCATAIVATGGEAGWSAYVMNADGTPYFASPEERAAIESAVAPLVPLVLYLFGVRDTLPIKGGAQDESPTIDGAYESIVKYVGSNTDVVRKFGREHGILHMIREQEAVGDLRPFAVFGPVGATIPVPPRAAFTFVYLALDVARMFLAAPFPGMRKVMSVILAIIDVLRGDWKAALLTFAGFYGQNELLAGVFGKVMLESFNLISPALKDSMIYGFRNFVKSLLFGSILWVFQTFAPWAARMEMEQALQGLQAFMDKRTEAAEREKLVQLPTYFREVSFNNIQNLQAILGETSLVCSAEMRYFVYSIRNTALIKNLIELMGIPTTEEEFKRRCGQDDAMVAYAIKEANDRYIETEKMIAKIMAERSVEKNMAAADESQVGDGVGVGAAAAATVSATPTNAVTAPISKQSGGFATNRPLRRSKYALLYYS